MALFFGIIHIQERGALMSQTLKDLFLALDEKLATTNMGIGGGLTGYMDGKVKLDRNGSAIVKGVDEVGRRFIRIQVELEKLEKDHPLGTTHFEGSFTIHERYEGKDDLWAIAENSEYDRTDRMKGQVSKFFQAHGMINEDAVKELIESGKVEADQKTFGRFKAGLIGAKPQLA